jgi:hypothetical protein
MATDTLQDIDEVVVRLISCRRQVTSRLCTMPTCLAPSSVQVNNQLFLVCGYPHTRNNWLFAGSLRAGKRAAAVMSLIHSARLNGHDVHAYLKDILARLPTQPASRIGELLPHRWHPATI